MGNAAQPLHWPRVLALAAASLILHVLALTAELARQVAPSALPATMTVALHSPPTPAPAPPVPAGIASAAPAPATVQLRRAANRARRAKPWGTQLRASAPPSAQLRFDVQRVESDGVSTRGEAVIDWRSEGGQYHLSATQSNQEGALLALESEGSVAASGLVPRTLVVQRRGKARTATHFDAGEGGISFSASQAKATMPAGTQDKASWPLQLAALARADPRQLAAGPTVVVGGERAANACRFALLGQETLDTPLGPMATWHLASVPTADSYRARLDVWLAPAQAWYPVQLRSTEASGAMTTQTIREIVTNEAEP
ncbi:MAG: DUF3108 domain-containing protein [Massilia sp.]